MRTNENQNAKTQQAPALKWPEKTGAKIAMASDEKEEERTGVTCSICESPVDDSGIEGLFGILPVAFCVWCYSSLDDMISQNCSHCIEREEAEENSGNPTVN